MSNEMRERVVGKGKRDSGHKIQIRLSDQVIDKRLYPTPTVCGNHNYKGASKKSGDGLDTFVRRYPTHTVKRTLKLDSM